MSPLSLSRPSSSAMLLPSLRSTIIRSTSIRSPKSPSRLYTSAQDIAGRNEKVIKEMFNTFGASGSTSAPVPTTQTPIIKTDTIPPAQDPLLKLFASRMMQGGKRARAEKSTSEILLHLSALTKAPALAVLRQAVEMAAPAVRVMSHKNGGKVLVKPVALNERQRTSKAIEWILDASDTRPGHTRGERVARECIGILERKSKVLESKDKAHQLAMVNRGNLPRIKA